LSKDKSSDELSLFIVIPGGFAVEILQGFILKKRKKKAKISFRKKRGLMRG